MSPSTEPTRFRRLGDAMKRRRSARSIVDTDDPLAVAIQDALLIDLRAGAKLMDSGSKNRAIADGVFEQAVKAGDLEGYCAIGAAAYFHLGGRREAGLQPMQRTAPDGNSSHWWIRRGDGRVVDLTVRPGDRVSFPYEKGRTRGFTNAGYVRPPQKAQQVMDRVIATTGRRTWT